MRPGSLELEVLIRGVFERRRFLDLLQHFIVFEEDPDAGSAQDHRGLPPIPRGERGGRGNHARQRHERGDADDKRGQGGTGPGRMHGGRPGDRRVGVVWHTQGSRQEFLHALLRRRIIRHPVMENPTLVVLTDRNDLDDQLFGQFQRCQNSAADARAGADRRALRELLPVASGGVVFTTIQKFLPEKGEKMPA